MLKYLKKQKEQPCEESLRNKEMLHEILKTLQKIESTLSKGIVKIPL